MDAADVAKAVQDVAQGSPLRALQIVEDQVVDFTAMNAMLAIMVVTAVGFIACFTTAYMGKRKAKKEAAERAAAQLSKFLEKGAASGPLSNTESMLENIRAKAFAVLQKALQIDRATTAAVENAGTVHVGYKDGAANGTLEIMRAASWNLNVVMFALVESVHKDSQIAVDVRTQTVAIRTQRIQLWTNVQEDRLMNRLMDVNNTIMQLEQVTEQMASAIAGREHVESFKQSVKIALRSLWRIARSSRSGLESPDPNASLAEVLTRGVNDGKWGVAREAYANLKVRVSNMSPDFIKGGEVGGLVLDHGAALQQEFEPPKGVWFSRMRRYPLFYSFYWILFAAIFISWMVQINKGSLPLRRQPIVDGVAVKGLGGFGVTFFDVPPQYELDEGNQRQNVGIPFVYAFMHCALMSLGLLPLTMTRGIWRVISNAWPGVRHYIPIDDFVHIHKQLGFMILGLLAAGAGVWMIVMYHDCTNVDDPKTTKACEAFAPRVNNFFDPVENVMMLRFLVWTTWFPLLPLLYWGNQPAPKFLRCLKFFRTYWFEFVYYIHLVVAYGILILALVARFDVFWPVLVSWGIYFLDRFRDEIFRAKAITVVRRDLYARPGQHINSMHLTFAMKDSGCCGGRLKIGAGQWVYVMIPAIDPVWHPFSIASETADDKFELHIGIRGELPKTPTDKMVDETWTYKLMKLVNQTGAAAPKPVTGFVRGPFGTTFSSCFDPSYAGCVVIGAGTGITAAESVLREIIRKRSVGEKTPARVWFVWSCRDIADLAWCFDRILDLCVDAADRGLLNPMTLGSNVKVFDWLGAMIYISRVKNEELEDFVRHRRDSVARGEEPVLTQTWIDPKAKGRVTGGLGNGVVAHDTGLGPTSPASGLSSAPSTVSHSQSGPSVTFSMDTDMSMTAAERMRAHKQTAAAAAAASPVLPDSMFMPSPASNPAMDIDELMLGDIGFEQPKQISDNYVEIQEFFLSRLVQGSLDAPHSHILRFLRGVRANLDAAGKDPAMTIGFCGPSPLATMLSDSVKSLGGVNNIEFSADHQ